MLNTKKIHFTQEEGISMVSTGQIELSKNTIHIPKKVQASILYTLQEEENNIHIILEEEAEVDLVCIHTSKGKEETSANIIVEHIGKKSVSSMTIKGVTRDASTLSIIGEIIIDEKASESEGYQEINILIIGEEATGKATPKLAIKNPLVVCSHGASIGGINKEQLYYLQSRGLNTKEAEEIIVSGFLNSIGKHMKHKELYTLIQESLQEQKNKGEE